MERKVSLGADQGTLVMVNAGLAAGDELIVRGQRDLSNGALVEVQERATERDGSMPGDPPSLRPGDDMGRFDPNESGTVLQRDGESNAEARR